MFNKLKKNRKKEIESCVTVNRATQDKVKTMFTFFIINFIMGYIPSN